jgi:hypothetical protein
VQRTVGTTLARSDLARLRFLMRARLNGGTLASGKAMRFLHFIVAFGALAAFATLACTKSSGAPTTPAEPQPSEARPLGSSWASCGFPPEAQASVGITCLRVLVSPNGAPSTVEITSAPEPAFAEHARRCALSKTYRPARTAAGEPLSAYTPTFCVRFQR